MKLIVIGLGISSLTLLHNLNDRVDAECFEEDGRIGEPEHCTGIVSEKLLKLIPLARRHILGKYRRIVIVDENFRTLAELDFKEKVYMVDRAGIDRSLYNDIEHRYRIYLKERIINISIEKRIIKILTNRNRVLRISPDSTIIILSEGARRALYRKITGKTERRYVYGIQCDCKISSKVTDPDTIIVMYSHKYAPGYFAWIVPRDDGYYRIGLGSSTHVKYRFLTFLKIFNISRIYKLFGGKILLDPGKQAFTYRNIIFLGDCGGFIKPLTGGGNTLSALVSTLLSRIILRNSNDIKMILLLYEYISNIIKRRFIRGFNMQRIVFSKILQRSINNLPVPYVAFTCNDYDLQTRYVLNPSLKRRYLNDRDIICR